MISIDAPSSHEAEIWYTLDGRQLNGKPTTRGIYINNGRKVLITKNKQKFMGLQVLSTCKPISASGNNGRLFKFIERRILPHTLKQKGVL